MDEAIGVANEVRGFWAKLFGSKPKPTAPAKKQKAKYVSVDETKVMADVVKQLTEFFRIQEQLAAHIREEEEKSRNVYDPDANLMESALNRVMALDQMAALEVEIREVMVYQTPGMGALYSKVFDMRNTIKQEQEQARLAQEAKERYKRWQLRQAQEKLKAQALYLVIAAVLLIYLYLWFAILVQWRKAKWGF